MLTNLWKNEEDDNADDKNSVDLEMDKVKANKPKTHSRVATAIILPIISSIRLMGGTNVTASALTDVLQGNNLVAASARSYYCWKFLGNTTVA
jgi:hypothetical protein